AGDARGTGRHLRGVLAARLVRGPLPPMAGGNPGGAPVVGRPQPTPATTRPALPGRSRRRVRWVVCALPHRDQLTDPAGGGVTWPGRNGSRNPPSWAAGASCR